MDSDLLSAVDKIAEALRAEDLFGAEDTQLPPATLLEFLSKEYEPLRQLTNVDRYSEIEDREAAEEASLRLAEFYADASERMALGLYGLPGFGRLRPSTATRSFRVGANTYFLGNELPSGDRCRLRQAFVERKGIHLGEVVVKLVANAGGNELAKREIANLAALHAADVPQWKHLPLVLDRFEAGGKIGLVMRKICGANLRRVRELAPHRNGVDQRDMVWMLDRILSCLGFVHRAGIVHGSINPDHVMLRGRDHNAFLVGWGNAVLDPAGTGLRPEAAGDVFTAPEVRDRGRIGPWSDIYSLGKLIIWLLGGDPETDRLPAGVAEPIRDFLLKLVNKNPDARPTDAWDVYQEQVRIKRALWKTAFRHFPMPDVD
ncbi:MAG: hypothetical protein U0136_06385 [Bdellovibrionota bacterium]